MCYGSKSNCDAGLILSWKSAKKEFEGNFSSHFSRTKSNLHIVNHRTQRNTCVIKARHYALYAQYALSRRNITTNAIINFVRHTILKIRCNAIRRKGD